MLNRIILVSGACLALTIPALAAQAQRTDGPVVVAITDTLPRRDARVMIMRHPRNQAKDVIVMKRSEVSAELLAAALAVLEDKRAKGRQDKELDITMLQGVSLPAMPDKLRSRLRRTLDRLADRPVTIIGDLGPGQWVRLPGTRRAP